MSRRDRGIQFLRDAGWSQEAARAEVDRSLRLPEDAFFDHIKAKASSMSKSKDDEVAVLEVECRQLRRTKVLLEGGYSPDKVKAAVNRLSGVTDEEFAVLASYLTKKQPSVLHEPPCPMSGRPEKVEHDEPLSRAAASIVEWASEYLAPDRASNDADNRQEDE
jgi:hypothetical protein